MVPSLLSQLQPGPGAPAHFLCLAWLWGLEAWEWGLGWGIWGWIIGAAGVSTLSPAHRPHMPPPPSLTTSPPKYLFNCICPSRLS